MCSSFLDINRGSSQTQVVPLFPFNSQKMPFTYLLLIWIAKSARENSLFWNIKFNCKSKKQKKKGGMVSVCVASLPFLSQGSPLGQRELQLSFQWTQRFQTGSDFFFFFFYTLLGAKEPSNLTSNMEAPICNVIEFVYRAVRGWLKWKVEPKSNKNCSAYKTTKRKPRYMCTEETPFEAQQISSKSKPPHTVPGSFYPTLTPIQNWEITNGCFKV